ncbi:Uncharacterized protein BP5553_07785 [Venustampulla echinocandica]|uniref:Uncharacterized protein n=1 Tax=Venustampulla echinocandica TaxID=2656787 RepID=A0A370THI0_9HELO|nr:Uncharacterized protein BP5553_07785 [Venustampulla echinocandica]RDL34657.1 Uncharacterized protein BP5553_07785 [Venustampulla echinocandica]
MATSSQKSRAAASYATRLDRTLKALQDRVTEQEALLDELRASTASVDTERSADPRSHLLQLRALTAVYETLTPQEPWLPAAESPLPSLLALRATNTCIKETQECITQTEGDLKEAQQQLEKEEAHFSDAKLIQADLETRISSFQDDIDKRTQKSRSQVVREMMREMEEKTTHYGQETGKLVTIFNEFIDDHLAAMLAAEELGGPIVGDILDVDEDMLEAGFSSQGKAKRLKTTGNPDRRQRRIDEIWGPKPSDNGLFVSEEPWDEKRAATAEMRELIEQLLNSLVEAGGTGPGAYVELQRESAAARFLIRAKVAQFHPNDARRLRLVDFGGELED